MRAACLEADNLRAKLELALADNAHTTHEQSQALDSLHAELTAKRCQVDDLQDELQVTRASNDVLRGKLESMYLELDDQKVSARLSCNAVVVLMTCAAQIRDGPRGEIPLEGELDAMHLGSSNHRHRAFRRGLKLPRSCSIKLARSS